MAAKNNSHHFGLQAIVFSALVLFLRDCLIFDLQNIFVLEMLIEHSWNKVTRVSET